MDSTEFARLVSLGLGRAVLHLRENDPLPFREVILDACLHSKAHDAQVSGSRADYMLDLINESGDPHFFANAVIQSLTEPPKAWDTEQRFCLARLLAQRGDQSARQAMYVAFRSLGKAASDVALAFIELDGIKGLLFVAAEIGAQLAQNPEQWEDESLLLDAERICGKEATESALATAAKADARIQSYLAAVEENLALRAANVGPTRRP